MICARNGTVTVTSPAVLAISGTKEASHNFGKEWRGEGTESQSQNSLVGSFRGSCRTQRDPHILLDQMIFMQALANRSWPWRTDSGARKVEHEIV
jgi:hypothetical protein